LNQQGFDQNPNKSDVTVSQSCKPTTPSLPESAHCSQMVPFDRVGTLSKQHVGPSSSSFTLFAICEGPSPSHYPFLEYPTRGPTQYTSRQTRYRLPREIQAGYGSWSNDPQVWLPVSHGKSSYPKQSPGRILTRRGKEKLLNYIHKKLQIPSEAFSNIDWENHSHVIRTVTIPNRIF
jgi:hypothetical protein